MDRGERDTVGKISLDLSQKEPETHSSIDLEREMHSDYEANINQCIEDNKKDFIGDFYIVVITKKERLMKNVLRNFFTARQSCPTPDYDQTVYRYNMAHGCIEFLWVLPDRGTCELLRDFAVEVAPEERELRDFVLSFYDGSLLKDSKEINGERENSNILQTTEL